VADPAGEADPARSDGRREGKPPDPVGVAVPDDQADERPEPPVGHELGPTRLVPLWVGWVLVAAGVVMLPWLAGLAVILPDYEQAAHYRAAWVGFDIALCVLLLRTGWLALRGREHMELSAAMTGTLLLVDAWFDVLTANNRQDLLVALAMALFGELPLAAFCLWIAGRVEYSRQRHTRLLSELLRHRRRSRGG